MVDELNRGLNSTRDERPLLSQRQKSKTLAKTLHNYEAGAKLSSPLLQRGTHMCTHTRTQRVTFYGLSSSSSSLYDF